MYLPGNQLTYNPSGRLLESDDFGSFHRWDMFPREGKSIATCDFQSWSVQPPAARLNFPLLGSNRYARMMAILPQKIPKCFFSPKQSPGKDYVELLRFVTPYKTLSSGLVKAVYFCWPCRLCWQPCYEVKIPSSSSKIGAGVPNPSYSFEMRNKQTTLRTPCVSL